ASDAPWLVKYYLQHGQEAKAEKLADWAAKVYSGAGLRAKAQFFELSGKLAQAYEYYLKIEERYKDNDDLLAFCFRQKDQPGAQRYKATWDSQSKKLFPQGIERIGALSSQTAPQDGVLIPTKVEKAELVRRSGLKGRDVIVAVNGIRVHNVKQYLCARDFSFAPEMRLAVWRDKRCQEIIAHLPEHRFNVDLKTYP